MSGRRNAIHKHHQIVARKSSARHQQSVKLEKVRGGRDGLRRAVVERLVADDINADC
jgi:hypothetical protein